MNDEDQDLLFDLQQSDSDKEETNKKVAPTVDTSVQIETTATAEASDVKEETSTFEPIMQAAEKQVQFEVTIHGSEIKQAKVVVGMDDCVGVLKTRIQNQLPEQVPITDLKLIFVGQQLANESVIKAVLGSNQISVPEEAACIPQKLHCLVSKKVEKQIETAEANVEEEKKEEPVVQVPLNDAAQPEQDAQRPFIADQNNPQAIQKPLSRDEILVTEKYVKYEQDLFDEYRKSVLRLEQTKSERDARDKDRFLRKYMQRELQEQFMYYEQNEGHFQPYRVDTNLSPKQNFLLTHLPLMDYGFQKRVGIYSASQNIMANLHDLNDNNNAIRFLGYDSILQPTLFMKLSGVMLIFGMNAPGQLKWACLVLLVTYYFNVVRCLYLDHFEQQRRLLNLNQPQVNLQQAAPGNQDAANEANAQAVAARERNVFMMFIHGVYVILRLVYLLVISLNHDWIDPILREYTLQRAAQLQAQEAERRARDEQFTREQEELARQEREAQERDAQQQADQQQQVLPPVMAPEQVDERRGTVYVNDEDDPLGVN